MQGNNQTDRETYWKEQYNRALAEKESIRAQLDEAGFLLEIKEEHIALLEKKIQEATILKSQQDGTSMETESLRNLLNEGREKLNRNTVIKNELEEELIASVHIEKNYLSLRETHTHTNNELLVLQTELKELLDLNKDLLKELEKMGQVQMQLELLQQENFELQKKIDQP